MEMKVIRSWVIGGMLVAIIPCVVMGAVLTGVVFRTLGVKIAEKK